MVQTDEQPEALKSRRPWLSRDVPVIGVVVTVTRRCVDIVVYQPMVGLRADADLVLLSLGEVTSVCIEVAQNHNVLQKRATKRKNQRAT